MKALSLWLLMPMHDSPADLYLVGTIWQQPASPTAADEFERLTYAEVMADVGHEHEVVTLSLDSPDRNGIGISQRTRTLYPASDLPLPQ